MYGTTRFGMFLVALTSAMLIGYRLLYYKGWTTGIFTNSYLFLKDFSIIFSMIFAIGATLVMSKVLRHFVVLVIFFFAMWFLVQYFSVGFTGVP